MKPHLNYLALCVLMEAGGELGMLGWECFCVYETVDLVSSVYIERQHRNQPKPKR